MPNIALDLMGGDHAPDEIWKGALSAARDLDVTVSLVGSADALSSARRSYGRNGAQADQFASVETTQIVGDAEPPMEAFRGKKDSSIGVGVRMVSEGTVDAFVSAGNTGAIATFSLFGLGAMEGIDRPAIATLYHTLDGAIALILDVGANPDCRPRFLCQFGQMGSDYLSRVFGVDRPKVALLSNGEEESKGNKLVKEAHRELQESGVNFIGNVEGFDLLNGTTDVVVTDGFTGNVVLKLAESLTGTIFMSLKDALGSNPLARATSMLWGPPVKGVAKRWDYTMVGGAPLLGVKGNIVMAHGRSRARDIRAAIELADRMIREGWSRPAVHDESRQHPIASN